jgi:hypothetical protein
VPGAAQDSCNPGGEFFRAEGFGEVVVGSRVQTQDAVVLGTAGGEHNHGDCRAAAKLGENFKAVQAREHHVQQDEIEAVFDCPGKPGWAVVDGVEGVAGVLKELGDELAKADVVINDENGGGLGIFLFHAASVLPQSGGRKQGINNS